MSAANIVRNAYLMARGLLRATGLVKPVRALVGPLAGRFVFRVSSNAARSTEVLGHQMYLAAPNGYPPLDMLAGRYEQETTKIFKETAKPGMVVLDIGAHVGYYSLLAARAVGPEGRIYSFEPEPMNYGLLVENAELNGYLNINPIRKAVSSQVGVTTLHLSALDNGRHSMFAQNLPHSGSETVETTTIDTFLEQEGWPAVGLIKMDVEGAELGVLQGMDRLLNESTKLSMIIEFNPGLLQIAEVDLLQFLECPSQWGFEVYVIDDKVGLLPLEQAQPSSLINRLLAEESSVNLFCQR